MLFQYNTINLSYKFINNRHWISSIKYNSFDSCLNQTFSACQTRICSNIACTTFGFCSTSFNNSVFFGVHTKTFIQSNSWLSIWIASLTSTLITIFHSKRSPIISSCHYSVILYNNSSYCPFHAVCSWRCYMSYFHKVWIPIWPQYFAICKIQIFNWLFEYFNILIVISKIKMMFIRMMLFLK